MYEYGMTTAPASSPVLPEEPQGAECDDARRVFFVIYNANAGRMRGGALKQLETFFSSRALDARFSTLDACDWGAVRALLRRGHEVRFVVAGGDGTLRLAMERLWQRDLIHDVTLAFVPLGSANVAARCLGLPLAMPKALEVAVRGTPRAVDLGVVNDRHVFFIAAIFGAVSDVTVNARREFKKRFGGLAYLLSIDKLVRGNYARSAFQVSYDDGERPQEISSHSMIVCNQFSIGNLKPVRLISPDDKHLDLITLHNTRFWGLLHAVWDYFRGRDDSRVLRHRTFEKAICHLKGFKGNVHLDGDACVDLGDKVDFRVMPHVVRIVC